MTSRDTKSQKIFSSAPAMVVPHGDTVRIELYVKSLTKLLFRTLHPADKSPARN